MRFVDDVSKQGEEGEALGEDIFRVLTAVTHRIDGDFNVVVETE